MPIIIKKDISVASIGVLLLDKSRNIKDIPITIIEMIFKNFSLSKKNIQINEKIKEYPANLPIELDLSNIPWYLYMYKPSKNKDKRIIIKLIHIIILKIIIVSIAPKTEFVISKENFDTLKKIKINEKYVIKIL